MDVCVPGVEGIKTQAWFTDVGFNWSDLLNRKMEAPFKPDVKNDTDTSRYAEDLEDMEPYEPQPYQSDDCNWDHMF